MSRRRLSKSHVFMSRNRERLRLTIFGSQQRGKGLERKKRDLHTKRRIETMQASM